jgi:hypothetical protein
VNALAELFADYLRRNPGDMHAIVTLGCIAFILLVCALADRISK